MNVWRRERAAGYFRKSDGAGWGGMQGMGGEEGVRSGRQQDASRKASKATGGGFGFFTEGNGKPGEEQGRDGE